jgi:DNA helicase HerA-like ATPase
MSSLSSTTDGAATTDGRGFRLEVTESHGYQTGDFVSVEAKSDTGLGLVEVAETDGRGRLVVSGRLFGAVSGSRDRPTPGVESAVVAPAEPELVETFLDRAGATLEVGRLATLPSVRARLLAHRFNRHTFWCGQSGSGKTYALGVLLEELLVHTELPLVIFDPNADFVRLDQVDPDASGESADLLRSRDVRILRAAGQPGEDLRVRFTAMSVMAKAALLRLDPLIDRAEYNTLLHLEDMLAARQPEQILPELMHSTDPEVRSFALRIENLGLLTWDMWAAGGRAATEIINDRPAATVLDLGGFATVEQPLVVALAVLDELWARRSERRPVLIVIDEAHNLCRPEVETPLQRMVLERIIQIAAEGRKYGLWLLLSTQRPSKIHAGIISQCDNLALMRMSSERDLDELAATLSFAPPALLAKSPSFRQGEALFAGGFVPAPTTVVMRSRLTAEGGRDVAVPLRS